jgi:hypothetical protein
MKLKKARLYAAFKSSQLPVILNQKGEDYENMVERIGSISNLPQKLL